MYSVIEAILVRRKEYVGHYILHVSLQYSCMPSLFSSTSCMVVVGEGALCTGNMSSVTCSPGNKTIVGLSLYS